ncbi:hypothetical protein SAMN04488498_101367 [Mesorhizobium albiziae]|uniref:Uncharacterized protein n=1 Tax=Neomesorhizobium albiziae TaxID=335020 RepID=A0A1I3VCX8_9HYPH|nr:hypothetical protein [Mesorhizobium albiziae]GLS28824.1 hypothetical protein GCM10007937_05310 [Mesorhizobium albiziae]SFJ93135.1 hypothetical protein SAMN04488498_101367 [Mesorhizobium albiziae]
MATRTKGFFAGALNNLIASRDHQAQRYVNGALLMLDDATLRVHGYKRDELKKWSSAYII